jgi:integrase
MSHLSLFLTFHNLDPDSLISNSPCTTRDMIIKCIIHLKKKARQAAGKSVRGEISVNSIPVYITGVQSFLDFHEIPLMWKNILKFMPETVPSDVRAYEKEEIRKMLAMADVRDRCILLIMCSGAVRVGALPDLRVKHQRILDEKNKIGMLVVYPNSRKDTYQTLLTPECMSSIEQYLNWRMEHGEKVTTESPLIRDKFDVFSQTRSNARPMSRQYISYSGTTCKEIWDKVCTASS